MIFNTLSIYNKQFLINIIYMGFMNLTRAFKTNTILILFVSLLFTINNFLYKPHEVLELHFMGMKASTAIMIVMILMVLIMIIDETFDSDLMFILNCLIGIGMAVGCYFLIKNLGSIDVAGIQNKLNQSAQQVSQQMQTFQIPPQQQYIQQPPQPYVDPNYVGYPQGGGGGKRHVKISDILGRGQDNEVGKLNPYQYVPQQYIPQQVPQQHVPQQVQYLQNQANQVAQNLIGGLNTALKIGSDVINTGQQIQQVLQNNNPFQKQMIQPK